MGSVEGSTVRNLIDYTFHLIEETGIITRNWVDSAYDKDYWIGLVNAAFNLRVS